MRFHKGEKTLIDGNVTHLQLLSTATEPDAANTGYIIYYVPGIYPIKVA